MRRSRAGAGGAREAREGGVQKARGEREGAQGKRKWRYVDLRVLEGDFLVQRRRRAAGLTHPHRKQQIYYIAVNGGLLGGAMQNSWNLQTGGWRRRQQQLPPRDAIGTRTEVSRCKTCATDDSPSTLETCNQACECAGPPECHTGGRP